jgi:hypothetical protein
LLHKSSKNTHNLVSTFGQADDKAEQALVLPDQQAEARKAVPAEESEEEIDGPSEIIWEGNQITVRKRKVKKSLDQAVAEVSYWTCLAWPSLSSRLIAGLNVGLTACQSVTGNFWWSQFSSRTPAMQRQVCLWHFSILHVMLASCSGR